MKLFAKVLETVSSFGKAWTNCFIMPNSIWTGGSRIFFGLTRLLCKMFLLIGSRDALGVQCFCCQWWLLAVLSYSYLVWSSWLILFSQLYTKVGIVHFSNEAHNVSLMFLNHKPATYITKTVWRVHTTTIWHFQSTTQYKIKFRLKNERALTASLEHEEVLIHSLLDIFSTAMLVQKIATEGAYSIYPSHMKKTPSVLMYVYWIKNYGSIELFYICIQYKLCILIQYANLILWKMVHGVSVISAYKNTWRRAKFFENIF
jgi:hypothetical protein